jgi:hypothetical protein
MTALKEHFLRPKAPAKNRYSLSALFLGALLVASTGFSAAHACSCAAAVTPEQALQRSGSVFTGTVVNIVPPPPGIISNTGSPEEVTFRVANVSKGPAPSADGTIVITTAVNGASCGYNFQVGGRYRVYAYNAGQNLQTDLCSGTNLISMDSTLPSPQANVPVVGPSSSPYYLMILAFAVLVSVVSLVFYARRRSRSTLEVGVQLARRFTRVVGLARQMYRGRNIAFKWRP